MSLHGLLFIEQEEDDDEYDVRSMADERDIGEE